MTTGSNQARPRIASLATAVPPHRVPQNEAVEFFQRSFDIPPSRRDRLKQLFLNAEIERGTPPPPSTGTSRRTASS